MNFLWSDRNPAFYRDGAAGSYTPHPAYAKAVPDNGLWQYPSARAIPVSEENLALIRASKSALVAVFGRVA